MLGVTTKTIKVLNVDGVKRGMILNLEDIMSCDSKNVVVKDVIDHTSSFGENLIQAIVISGKDIGKEIIINADHTYRVKIMSIVESKPNISGVGNVKPVEAKRTLPADEEEIKEHIDDLVKSWVRYL